MRYSLNEIEAMGKRAARGAGLSWGLAEEAGKAARWLAARDLPGPELLAEILACNDGKDYDDLAPRSTDGVWRAPSGPLCPLVAGPALCDRAAEIAGGSDIALGPTAIPLLLAPYAAGAARLAGSAVELSWQGAAMVFTPDGVSIAGDHEDLTARHADSVRCRRRGPMEVASSALRPGREVDGESWSRLDALAARICAPATETSRLTGAGAGVNDTD